MHHGATAACLNRIAWGARYPSSFSEVDIINQSCHGVCASLFLHPMISAHSDPRRQSRFFFSSTRLVTIDPVELVLDWSTAVLAVTPWQSSRHRSACLEQEEVRCSVRHQLQRKEPHKGDHCEGYIYIIENSTKTTAVALQTTFFPGILGILSDD